MVKTTSVQNRKLYLNTKKNKRPYSNYIWEMLQVNDTLSSCSSPNVLQIHHQITGVGSHMRATKIALVYWCSLDWCHFHHQAFNWRKILETMHCNFKDFCGGICGVYLKMSGKIIKKLKKLLGILKKLWFSGDFSINFRITCRKYCLNVYKNSWDLKNEFVEVLEIFWWWKLQENFEES